VDVGVANRDAHALGSRLTHRTLRPGQQAHDTGERAEDGAAG